MTDTDNPGIVSSSETVPPSALRREMTIMITGITDVITTRLDAIDKATEIFQANLTRVPTDVDKQIGALRSIVNEQLLRIEQGIAQNDLRYEQRYIASQAALSAAFLAAQSAVNAALASAKDAVQAASVAAEKAVMAQNEANSAAINKTELSVAKQIDGIMISLTLSAKTLDEKIGLINARLDRGDGISMNKSSNQSNGFAMGSMAIAAIAVVFTLLSYVRSLSGSSAPPNIVYADRPTIVPLPIPGGK